MLSTGLAALFNQHMGGGGSPREQHVHGRREHRGVDITTWRGRAADYLPLGQGEPTRLPQLQGSVLVILHTSNGENSVDKERRGVRLIYNLY